MAKKEIRVVTASGDIAPLIDRGADVDIELKNLTVEDKGIKARIGEVTGSSLQDGETGIRLKGEKSSAVVTVVEKLELNASADGFAEVQKAVDMGLLSGIVDRSQQLRVPEAYLEKAAEVLKAAGINALIEQGYAINSEGFKKMATSEVLSTEQGNAQKALMGCVEKSRSYRVKYERE